MNAAPCPRCGHRPGHADRDTHPGVCPACGIAIAKWKARADAPAATARPQEHRDTQEISLLSRVNEQLLLPPEGMDATGFGARAVLLGALGLWTLELEARGKGTAAAIDKDLRANMVPGITIVPAMVIAIEQAQAAGISYNRQ